MRMFHSRNKSTPYLRVLRMYWVKSQSLLKMNQKNVIRLFIFIMKRKIPRLRRVSNSSWNVIIMLAIFTINEPRSASLTIMSIRWASLSVVNYAWKQKFCPDSSAQSIVAAFGARLPLFCGRFKTAGNRTTSAAMVQSRRNHPPNISRISGWNIFVTHFTQWLSSHYY